MALYEHEFPKKDAGTDNNPDFYSGANAIGDDEIAIVKQVVSETGTHITVKYEVREAAHRVLAGPFLIGDGTEIDVTSTTLVTIGEALAKLGFVASDLTNVRAVVAGVWDVSGGDATIELKEKGGDTLFSHTISDTQAEPGNAKVFYHKSTADLDTASQLYLIRANRGSGGSDHAKVRGLSLTFLRLR